MQTLLVSCCKDTEQINGACTLFRQIIVASIRCRCTHRQHQIPGIGKLNYPDSGPHAVSNNKSHAKPSSFTRTVIPVSRLRDRRCRPLKAEGCDALARAKLRYLLTTEEDVWTRCGFQGVKIKE